MPTILVVDDEEPVRGFLARLLMDDGYQVRLANHGRHALELMEKDLPDLVLSDVMMPVLSGRELCQRLKSREETRDIPVILMTSSGQKATEGTGADDSIAKPFDLDAVEALVQRWLPGEAVP